MRLCWDGNMNDVGRGVSVRERVPERNVSVSWICSLGAAMRGQPVGVGEMILLCDSPQARVDQQVSFLRFA